MLPSAAWIGVVALVAGTYDWRNVLMVNQVFGDWAQWSDHWHYWFIEAVTSLLLGTALLMASRPWTGGSGGGRSPSPSPSWASAC